MSDFAVLVSAVQQASSAAQSASADLGAEVAMVRREADAVLSGRWRGRAATGFDRMWASWDAGAREVVTALDRLAEALAMTGHEYAARDELAASGLFRAGSLPRVGS